MIKVSHLIFCFLLLITLASCGSQSAFKSKVMEINNNQIKIDVTDHFSKEKSGKDIGFFLDVIVTESTEVQDSKGNKIELDEISVGDMVKVKLAEPISKSDFSKTKKPIKADDVVLQDS